MSAETRAAIERAIQEHVADEAPGSVVSGWVAVMERVDLTVPDDNMTRVMDVNAEGQSLMTTLGLLTFSQHHRMQAR